ncbi:g9219 [Coccomyxa elongata]
MVSHRHEQAAATASVRHFSSSSQTLVVSQQAERPPLNHAATTSLVVPVLEKALRDQFPLGPPPQVGASLLTSSLADVLKLPDTLPAVNASYYLPLHLSRNVPQSEPQQKGEADVQTIVSANAPTDTSAVHEFPQRKKKKHPSKDILFPSLQQTGIGIRLEDFEDVRDQLNKKLSWNRKATPFLTKAFQVVEVDGPTHPTMQLLPVVAQVADSLDWLLARFSTLQDPQKFVRISLLRCPQLLTAPPSQLAAAISFLEFLNLSTEEVASCLTRRPSLLLEDLETRLFPLCEYLDSIGIPPEQQRLIVVMRPHVLTQPLEDIRTQMAFLVGSGVQGRELTQLVTSAKGLLSVRRPVLALRMRMLKDFLGGDILDMIRYPDYLLQRTWRVGARVALMREHGREILLPSQVDEDSWNKALRSQVFHRKMPFPLPKLLDAPFKKVCKAVDIPVSKGVAFVERWEAEEGKVWSETAAEEAAICLRAADIDVDAPVEELDITPLINAPEEVLDGAEEDEALPGIVL